MRKICHRIAVEFFDKEEEPIAPFVRHDKALLESALNLPRATFDGKELYPELIAKVQVKLQIQVKRLAL